MKTGLHQRWKHYISPTRNAIRLKSSSHNVDKIILTPQNKMTPWLGHPSSWKKGWLFHGSIYFLGKWKMGPEIWPKVPSDAWKKPPPETFTASTVTKVAPGSKLMGNCGSGTMSCVCVLVYSPIQAHRDFGINLHLPFLVRGVNSKVYMPFILGRYVQSTPTCQNNLKQKSQRSKGFLHHLFHTFLVLKHTVTLSLQHWSPCRSISHQCCRASPSGTSQISPYPPSEIGSSLEVH